MEPIVFPDLSLLIVMPAIAVGIAILLAILWYVRIRQAKKEAKRMLDLKTIDNQKLFNWVSTWLARIPFDLEAKRLWERLQDLKEKATGN